MSVGSIIHEPMLAILPKCYQSQGQPFLILFRTSKNLEIHKESHSMVQKNGQINGRSESNWGLMELGVIYTMLSDFNSSNQDTICKITFFPLLKEYWFHFQRQYFGYIPRSVTPISLPSVR